MDYVYRFPVVRGIQAGSEYYIAMVPLKMLSKLFSTDEEEYIPPEYRAQRRLNESRIPVISKYILDNRENYVFSDRGSCDLRIDWQSQRRKEGCRSEPCKRSEEAVSGSCGKPDHASAWWNGISELWIPVF